MKPCFIAFIFAVCTVPGLSRAQEMNTLGKISQWRLNTAHGDVNLKLSNVTPRNETHLLLSLEPSGDSQPTSKEEEPLLRRVFYEMTQRGYDPSRLVTISTWLQNSEFKYGVEHAVSESGKWKSCLGRKYCYAAEVAANNFLSAADAFKAFDTVLHEYGLKRKTVRVDGLGIEAKDRGVLCQGLIVISLELEKGKLSRSHPHLPAN